MSYRELNVTEATCKWHTHRNLKFMYDTPNLSRDYSSFLSNKLYLNLFERNKGCCTAVDHVATAGIELIVCAANARRAHVAPTVALT